MTTDPQTPESLGIAQKLAQDFLPAFVDNRDSLTDYFGEEATLLFQGNEICGIDKIAEYIHNLPDLMLKVTGFDVQTIQSPKSWTMAIYTGTILIESDVVQDFHCSIFVETDPPNNTSFIRYMTFKYF